MGTVTTLRSSNGCIYAQTLLLWVLAQNTERVAKATIKALPFADDEGDMALHDPAAQHAALGDHN